MIAQHVYIRKYDWEVCIFYDATPRYSSVIMRELWKCGIPAEKYWEAEGLLTSGRRNEGLTFTNQRSRQSVVVIGRTSSVGQFCSTLTHELDHLADHISVYYGIPLGSEENAELHGELMRQILEEAAEEIGGRFKEAWHYLKYLLRG